MLFSLAACRTEQPADLSQPPSPKKQAISVNDGRWSPTGRMANSRLLFTATRLPDGRVLAAGGYNRSAEIYDPATGTWSRTADAPNTYRAATATLLPNGKVLVAGAGGAEWNSGLSAALYDPEAGTWQPAGALRTPRFHHTATLLANGQVLVTGGTSGEHGGNVLAATEVYDPASNTWAPTGSLAMARRNHTATLLPDGRVLVTGGTHGGGTLQNSAEVYDPAVGTWSPSGHMATARSHHSATLLADGRVLIAGGGGSDWASGASSELFDPASGTWVATASMAKPRRNHSATALLSGKVLVAGGFHEYTGILTVAEVYDPADNSWHAAGNMAADRYRQAATLLADGRVLVAGGFSNANQASAELYSAVFAPEPGPPVGEPVEPVGTSLLIQVVDMDGAALSGATVTLAGDERTTDSQGNALFEGIAAGSSVAQVRAPGFAAGTLSVELDEGAHASALATLKPLTPPVVFNASEDATIIADQIQVAIPAGSLRDENGQPVTGAAEISFAPIDPTTDEIESAPGPLEAIAAAGEEPVSLESGYMAEIALSQNGRPLQLAPGATAAITFPLSGDFAASSAPGDVIPAWWFDAEAGVWREDGAGIVEESPTEPGKLIWTAEVSHFTSWNCDKPFVTQSCLNVLVMDEDGRPLPGRTVTVRGMNYSYVRTLTTRSNGTVCVPARRGYTSRVSVGTWWSTHASTVVTPTVNATCGRSGCMQVTLRVPVPCGTPGTVQACAYSGPAGTNSVGACKAGYRVCNGLTWGACTGQVTPTPEVCNNAKDEDCDGQINNGCPVRCTHGSTESCYTGPAGTGNVGQCLAGRRTCVNGAWGSCTGEVKPAAESCKTPGDDDCDGLSNEGCACTPGQTQSCAYTGPAGTDGVGQCRAGVRTCFASGATPFWGACAGEVVPTGDSCDGRDNNCNGQTDEGNPGGGVACATGKPGVCAQGTTACSGGTLVCNPKIPASKEICDGLDNDCNGQVDEGNPGGNAACMTGQPGVCAQGTTTCSGGTLVCNAIASPSSEVCDGLDNDCNGQSDESNPGGGAACSTGQPGVCSPGTTICSGGALSCSAKVSPSSETCDGLDNNCNGQSDEGNPGGGAACSTGQPGVCAQGTTSCSGGTLTCNAPAPSAEVCDGRDNDCDSTVDEGNPGGGVACTTGQPGVCSQGTTSCSGGALSCSPNTAPSSEVCGDRLDNDCDGQTDEGCSTGGTFFYSYSASNTSSATQNTVNRTVTLTAGQTIRVTTCASRIPGASASGDTYLRLYAPSNAEVASNDDECGSLASYLMYTVPPGGGGSYTIRAGCYSGGSCSGTVGYSF